MCSVCKVQHIQMDVDIQELHDGGVYITILKRHMNIILGHDAGKCDVVSGSLCPGAALSNCHDALKVALFCAAFRALSGACRAANCSVKKRVGEGMRGTVK